MGEGATHEKRGASAQMTELGRSSVSYHGGASAQWTHLGFPRVCGETAINAKTCGKATLIGLAVCWRIPQGLVVAGMTVAEGVEPCLIRQARLRTAFLLIYNACPKPGKVYVHPR